MEAAVTTVLAEQRLTAWDVFGDRRTLLGFKPSRRTASQAAGGPHSSWNLWQPQVTGNTNVIGERQGGQLATIWIVERTMLGLEQDGFGELRPEDQKKMRLISPFLR